MSNKFFSMTSVLALSAGIAVADVPKVAVDIAPVHSLVSKVMNGLGEPKLIIPAEASPHEYQLRPSEAKALQEARKPAGGEVVPLVAAVAEVLGVEVKTFSGGHVRFMSKAELQRHGDVVFVHYDWTSARRRGYRRGHGSGARTPDSPVKR